MSGLDNVTKAGDARGNPRKVFCTETGALTKGYGVCYNRAAGTATAVDGTRDTSVALPTQSTNYAFAGVLKNSYPANAAGQWVEIEEPGAIAQVYVDASVTIGEKVFATCQIAASGTGQFHVATPGMQGRGTVRIMQTRAGAGLVLAEIMDGQQSGLVEQVTLTTGANVLMVGGVTKLLAATLASGATFTLADGTFVGQRKLFIQTGTLTTNGLVVTVTTGIQQAATTALATVTFAAGAGTKHSILEWNGAAWKHISFSATSPTQA